MLRLSRQCRGSFITNQRVFADWWQPFYREETHRLAQQRLKAAVAAAADGAPAEAREGEGQTRPLSLREANGLAITFASQHNLEDLSATVQYVRETLGADLSPFHFGLLLRVFNYHYDRDGVTQLLRFMAAEGSGAGTPLTPEAYARVLDSVHVNGCSAAVDALPTVLRVCSLAQEAFGTLLFREARGSEAAVTASFSAAADGQRQEREEEGGDGDGDGTEAEEPSSSNGGRDGDGDGPVSSPVLSSLLHHVCQSGAYGPLEALIVCVWIRAAGAELSDWDTVNWLCSLVGKAYDFPRLRAVAGVFAGFPPGSVSPAALLERLEALGECAAPDSAAAALSRAMRQSLVDSGVDLAAPVAVGLANAQVNSLHLLAERTLEHALSRGPGVGSRRYNFAFLYNTLLQLYSTTGDDTAAARTFLLAVRAQAEWERRQRGRRESGEDDEGEGESAEPFFINHHFLMDTGSLFARLGGTELEALAGPFAQHTERVAREARERELSALTNFATTTTTTADDGSNSSHSGADAEVIPTLGAPALPSPVDLVSCESYCSVFLRSDAEAREALRRAIRSVDRTRVRQSRSTRLLFRHLAEYCVRHPRRNSKYTAAGLAARQKWGAYLDARDTALSLFGSARLARESMKQLFYNGNKLTALRSAAMVTKDARDAAAVLFPHLDAAEVARVATETLPGRRTTLPHVRCSADVVPAPLWDPAVYNPYPHAMLSLGHTSGHRTRRRRGNTQQEEEEEEGDFFADLWGTLMDPAVMGSDLWFVRNTDMYLTLMRCLLHRLDWEAAAHLTTRMLEQSSYTYAMDHELTLLFREAGDPAGCLAFKVATKLFDGRIMRDGQTRREQYHQELFS